MIKNAKWCKIIIKLLENTNYAEKIKGISHNVISELKMVLYPTVLHAISLRHDRNVNKRTHKQTTNDQLSEV